MKFFSEAALFKAIKTLGGQPVNGVFEKMHSAYAADSRHYQNAMHIEDCLCKLDRFQAYAANPALIALALFYHDIVYDSRRADNEERSAVWAQEDLSAAALDTAAIQNIHDMIRATQTHQGADADTQLLLDIDLSILGAEAEAFAAYDQAIQAEYAWVNAADYAAGRKKVLAHFLQRERIYLTPVIAAAYEQQARHNLSQALARLNAS